MNIKTTSTSSLPPGRIYLSSPHMSSCGFEQKYINEAFASNWIAPMGANVTGFEEEFSEKLNSKHENESGSGNGHTAVITSAALISGTAAIHLALRAAGVKRGDTVFCSDLTFSASANPVIYESAAPVFIDSDLETWCLSPRLLEEAFRKYPRAKAVIAVHLYGMCADIGAVREICGRHGAALIEDAAEALGSLYKGGYAGTFGEYGVFSFNGNKIITTSGGGMLVSPDAGRVEKARFWAQQSRDPARHYQHSELGFNYRMSNIIAGVGRGQLRVLDERVAKKRYIFDYYRRALEGTGGMEFMPMNGWNEPNCWLTCAVLPEHINPLDVMLALESENIESRPIWKPMHMQPFFEKYDRVGGGVAERLFERGVCLPSDTKMTDGQLERVAGIVEKVLKK